MLLRQSVRGRQLQKCHTELGQQSWWVVCELVVLRRPRFISVRFQTSAKVIPRRQMLTKPAKHMGSSPATQRRFWLWYVYGINCQTAVSSARLRAIAAFWLRHSPRHCRGLMGGHSSSRRLHHGYLLSKKLHKEVKPGHPLGLC
jgi:hypothetical protein